MIFSGVDNRTIELKISNYQFPENQEGDWDGNWLNIYLKVESKVGKWQTIDPSLTTWEFNEIIEWLNKLYNNKEPEYRLISFIEPNLSFELLNKPTDDKKLIRIKFDLESRPKSATDDKDYFVDILADNDELIKIINELKNELHKFPERKPTA